MVSYPAQNVKSFFGGGRPRANRPGPHAAPAPGKKTGQSPGGLRPVLLAAGSQDLDLGGFLFGLRPGLGFGQAQFQDAVLEARFHILGLELLAHIEAARAAAGVALLPDVAAFPVFSPRAPLRLALMVR